MDDVNLTADLLIAMCEGIKEKKKIKIYYDKYEKLFDYDSEDLQNKFDFVMNVIQKMYGNSLKETEFKRVHLFYSLFTAIYHIKYGLKDFVIDNQNRLLNSLDITTFPRICYRLERINYIFDAAEKDLMQLSKEEQIFIDYSRRATTDASKRVERTKFIVKLITNDN